MSTYKIYCAHLKGVTWVNVFEYGYCILKSSS